MVLEVSGGKGYELSLTFHDGLTGDGGIGADAPLEVDHFNGDKCQVLAIGRDNMTVRSKSQRSGFPSGGKRRTLVICFCTQYTRLVRHSKDSLEFCISTDGLGTDEFVVQI